MTGFCRGACRRHHCINICESDSGDAHAAVSPDVYSKRVFLIWYKIQSDEFCPQCSFPTNEDFGIYPRTRVRCSCRLAFQPVSKTAVFVAGPSLRKVMQEQDRALLSELEVDATFEPFSLYTGRCYHPAAGLATLRLACKSAFRGSMKASAPAKAGSRQYLEVAKCFSIARLDNGNYLLFSLIG